MYVCVVSGHVHDLKVLRDLKVNIHFRNDEQMTALHLAAFNGRPKVVQLLLEWGFDINAQNKYSETALHLACADGERAATKQTF